MKQHNFTRLTPALIASITDVDAAFGGGAKHLPPMSVIPPNIETTEFYRLALNLWSSGKPATDTPSMTLRKEFEPVANQIPRFVGSILSSFEPKHEHKLAGMAFLLSEMFILD